MPRVPRMMKRNTLIRVINKTKIDYKREGKRILVSEMEEILYDTMTHYWGHTKQYMKGFIDDLKKEGWLTQEYLDE